MTSKQLRALMKRHDVSVQDLCEIAAVSLATVRAWLRPKTSKAHRDMTAYREKLIRDKIAEKRGLASDHTNRAEPQATADTDAAATARPGEFNDALCVPGKIVA